MRLGRYGDGPVPRRTVFSILAALVCALVSGRTAAQPTAQLQRELEGVGVEQQRGAALPADAKFTDDAGREVRLGDFAGRPMLLTLNYASCPMLCNLQLGALAEALAAIGEPPAHARMIRVSLAPTERVAEARQGHRVYLARAGGSDEMDEAMRFLVGPEESIRAVADAVGFHYRYLPDTGEYAHVATLVVVTSDGRVSDYIDGITFDPAVLRAAAERAARNEISPMSENDAVDAVLNCFRYEPTGNAAVAMIAVRVSGVVVLVGFGAFLGVLALKRRRRTKKHETEAD